MMKVFAALGVVAAAGVLSICPLCDSANNVLHAQPVAHGVLISTAVQVPVTSVVTLKVTGMTCGGCVLGVRKVLTRLDGVTKADVSYDKANAVVTFDPKKATVEQMIAAIKTLGYAAAAAS